MRHRIVVATVGVLAVALVAFTVPLAFAVRGLLVGRALDGLQAQTEQAAIVVDEQARTCGQVEFLLALVGSRQAGLGLALFSTDGDVLTSVGGHVPTNRGEVQQVVAGGASVRRHSAGSLAVATPLSTNVCNRRLLLHAQQPDAAVTTAIERSWAGIGLVGITVLGVGALIAWVVGRRLTRPLDHLAAAAAALGEGDFSIRAPRSGLPEVDAVADTLDRTADRLGRAVDRSRTFAADASHQLRTPMTALRLHLESLVDGDVASDKVAAALAEADRLEATVAELVALTSLETAEDPIDAADLVAPPVAASRAAAASDGRTIDLEVAPAAPVRVRPAAIRQALAVLLDNAIEHGVGSIRVTVAPTLPDHPDRGVRVCVSDDGPGPPAEVLDRLTAADRARRLPLRGGRGLALAHLLVEGEGGRLASDVVDGHRRVCLVLPAPGSP